VWVVDNNTPLVVDRGFLRDRQGGEVWIVVIKGSFDVGPKGDLRIAAEQVRPCRGAAWSGEPGQSSLLCDTDFVLTRPGTDVLVRGHAYAPRGRPVTSVEAGLRIGSLVKRIRVHGIRAWMASHFSSAIVPGSPRPLHKVPLSYENAFGGSDTTGPSKAPRCCAHNPVGKGFSHRPKQLIGRAAPQLEQIDDRIEAGPHDSAPAGFGPIAPSWKPRAAWAGTYDATWEADQAPLLPKDFDERFYRSAPPDQQLRGYLPAGQTIELFNMTPAGYWKVTLPALAFRTRTIFGDREEQGEAVLHTAWLEPDLRRVQLVWHLSLPCHGREHMLRRTIVDWQGDRTCLSPSTSMG
jgi:hypothetical protein